MNKDYYEVVIEGHLDLMKGFVMGFLAGRGIEGGAFFDEACHIEGENAAGPLLRLISAHDNVSTLIVGSGLYDLLVAALNRHPQVIALQHPEGPAGLERRIHLSIPDLLPGGRATSSKRS